MAIVGVAALTGGIPAGPAIAVGAVIMAAPSLIALATTFVSELAAGEILGGSSPDISAFTNTLRGFFDYYCDALTKLVRDSIVNLGGDAGKISNTLVSIAAEIFKALNLADLNSVASQVVANSNLFSNSSSALAGVWRGTYNRTPSNGCPAYSGQLAITVKTYDDGSFDGPAEITNVTYYDSACKVLVVENDGTVGDVESAKITGRDMQGNLTVKGTFFNSFNDLNYFFWQFTATMANNTISGTFLNGAGTFTVTR